MANPKTYMLFLYLVLYSGLSMGDLDHKVVDRTEKALKALEEFSTALTTVTDVAKKIGGNSVKAGETLSKVVKVFSTVSKVASSFSFIGALTSFIFAFIPQHDPVMEFMKEQFAEVNRKLDSLSHQVSNLQKDVRWTAYTSIYSQDESNIENSWKKLQELMENAPLAKTKEEKVRTAERFTKFYEDTATENSVLKFYSYLTVKETSLKENLLNLVIVKFKGDFKVLVQFSSHFTGLMLKGLQLNLYYYALKGYNRERKVKEASENMSNVVAETQEAMIKCINNLQKFAPEDVNAKSPCSNHPCKNGMCNPIKGTTSYICKCNKPFYGPTCEDTVENDLKWEEIQENINDIEPVPDLTAIYFSFQDLANALHSDIKWTQIFVKYGDIISIFHYFVEQHQLLQNRTITNELYVKEIGAHITGKSFHYRYNQYNHLMMGTGFGDKSNSLDSYRSAILLQKHSPDSVACSKDYVDSVDEFVRYMFALETESHLAWYKYLLLTSKSKDIQQYEIKFKHHVEEQWKLFNRNGCGSLKAERLSNSFCEKPYHSTVNQQISITCTDSYRAYPQNIQCSRGKWSQLVLCYKKPSANGNTVCKSENGKTVCEARCASGWAFPDGKKSITSTCSQQPCKSFTPPSCTRCADNKVCSDHEVCRGGMCVDGCKANPCGRNTVCRTSNHVRTCTCQSGWSGSNPDTGCNYRDVLWLSFVNRPQDIVKSAGHTICRTKGPDGEFHGGRVHHHPFDGWKCNYEYKWKERHNRDYQVLVDPCGGNGVEWQYGLISGNNVPVVQWPRQGFTYYVCSATDKRIPGKLFYSKGEWHCNVGYQKSGKKYRTFYSLVQRPCL